MNTFEPGWVPQGWTRGQELRVIVATPHREGAIWPHWTPDTVLSGVQLGNDIGVVAFKHADGAKVEAWLEWWWEKSAEMGAVSHTQPSETPLRTAAKSGTVAP